jgi:hypothetical protein
MQIADIICPALVLWHYVAPFSAQAITTSKAMVGIVFADLFVAGRPIFSYRLPTWHVAV